MWYYFLRYGSNNWRDGAELWQEHQKVMAGKPCFWWEIISDRIGGSGIERIISKTINVGTSIPDNIL